MDSVSWNAPLNLEDFDAAAQLIRERGGIVSVFAEHRSGDWKAFFEDRIVHGTEFFAHIDSNFLSKLLQLFQKQEPVPDQCRQVAAIMALVITFDIPINPTCAVHEYALTTKDDPVQRLAGFDIANNVSPMDYADIVCRRSHCIPASNPAVPKRSPADLATRIKGYGATYIALLKLLTIHTRAENQPAPKIDSRISLFTELLDWMFHDFFFIGPVLLVAHEVFGQSGKPLVLKGVNTRNADSLIASTRNAAWDLVLARVWSEYEGARRPHIDPIHLLFTLDQPLARLTLRLLHLNRDGNESFEDAQLKLIREFWPEPAAQKIFSHYSQLMRRLDDPVRAQNRESPYDPDELEKSLEAEVRSNLGLGGPA